MADTQNSLPPGWDCKLDPRTNRYYFINHYTRLTTWEDPRSRYRQIHGTPSNVPSMPGEHIPLQHGSPDIRRNYVYPSQICPQPAFQIPSQYSPKSFPIQEMNSMSKMSPTLTKVTHAIAATRASPSLARTHETSLTSAQDTEQAVTKISAMFPTVSETHIRFLLKKYYNREAVVISALQVEKHPITTPGPFTTPPPSRNIQQTSVHGPLQMTPPIGLRDGSRTGSPVTRPGSGTSSNSPHLTDYRNSPKLQSSPKMKLRYMKSIFPKVEETIILDVLGNNDNNVLKTSEALKEMGYEKVDNTKAMKKTKSHPEKTVTIKEDKPKPSTPPKIKTLQEKNQVKSSLQDKYKEIPERVIVIALESVDFDKDKAIQILDIMVKEEDHASKQNSEPVPAKDDSKKEAQSTKDTLPIPKMSVKLPSPSKAISHGDRLDMGKARRTKEKINSVRNSEDKTSSQEIGYTSLFLTPTVGPNPNLVKGSDEGMLLEDYMIWDGPDPTLRQNHRALAKGPNSSLLSKRIYEPRGPNKSLCRGPALGLAKGSIYSQLKSVVVGESRGK